MGLSDPGPPSRTPSFGILDETKIFGKNYNASSSLGTATGDSGNQCPVVGPAVSNPSFPESESPWNSKLRSSPTSYLCLETDWNSADPKELVEQLPNQQDAAKYSNFDNLSDFGIAWCTGTASSPDTTLDARKEPERSSALAEPVSAVAASVAATKPFTGDLIDNSQALIQNFKEAVRDTPKASDPFVTPQRKRREHCYASLRNLSELSSAPFSNHRRVSSEIRSKRNNSIVVSKSPFRSSTRSHYLDRDPISHSLSIERCQLSSPTNGPSATKTILMSSSMPSAHASLSDLIAASNSFQEGSSTQQQSEKDDTNEVTNPSPLPLQTTTTIPTATNLTIQQPSIDFVPQKTTTTNTATTNSKSASPSVTSNIDMAIPSSPSADRIITPSSISSKNNSSLRPKFVRHRSKTTGSVSKHDKTPQGLASRPPVQISVTTMTNSSSRSSHRGHHSKSKSYHSGRPHTAPSSSSTHQNHRRTNTTPHHPTTTSGTILEHHSIHSSQPPSHPAAPVMSRPSSRPTSASPPPMPFSGNPFEDPSLVGDVLSASRSGDMSDPVSTGAMLPLHPLRSTSTGSKSTALGDVFDQLPSLPLNDTFSPSGSLAASAQMSSIGGGRLGQSDSKLYEFDPLFYGGGGGSLGAEYGGGGDANTTSISHNAATSAAATATSLKELAAQLSEMKPRVPNQEEELDLRKDDHRVTLGDEPKESTGTAKSHRRFYSGAKHVFKGGGSGGGSSTASATGVPTTPAPVNSMSLGVDEMGAVVTQLNVSGDENREHKRSMTHTGVGSGFFSKSILGMGKKNIKSESASPNRTVDLDNIGSNSSSPEKTKDLSLVLSNESIESGRSTFLGKGDPGKSPGGGGRRKIFRLGGGKDKKNELLNAASASPIDPNHQDSSDEQPVKDIQLRSSEQDPSHHQIEIPSHSDFKFQANLCELFDKYRKLDQNFDFAGLIGLSRFDMESFCNSNAKECNRSRSSSPLRSRNNSDRIQLPSNEKVIMQNLPQETLSHVQTSIPAQVSISTDQQRIIDTHKPILSSVLDAGDDLVVEGFYHEVNDVNVTNPSFDTAQEKATVDRMEVAIFQSDKNRQFYVVYQGSCETQVKPVRNRDQKAGTSTSRFSIGGSSNTEDREFSPDQPVSVFPPFKKAYFSSNLEGKVFSKLDELAEKHPFFDVIITGHSFGGALALLASMRYADLRPAIMVSCFAFGCPKVGALNFRYYVHSLPNLKVMRVEYGSDPWTNAPDSPNWTHAGHSIVITLQVQPVKAGGKGSGDDEEAQPETAESNNNKQTTLLPQVLAHKFGNSRPISASTSGKLKTLLSRQANRQEKSDHDIASYIQGIEFISKASVEWPKDFAGEHGTGVHGLDKEKRLVV